MRVSDDVFVCMARRTTAVMAVTALTTFVCSDQLYIRNSTSPLYVRIDLFQWFGYTHESPPPAPI